MRGGSVNGRRAGERAFILPIVQQFAMDEGSLLADREEVPSGSFESLGFHRQTLLSQ